MKRLKFGCKFPSKWLSFQSQSTHSAFQLVLAKSQQTVEVGANESPLEALERIGIDHPYACREGLCGTCEVRVLDGQPDHKDNVLSEQERTAGQRFIPCISRCNGPQLVIEL
jgi:ferredoxin